jgi:hypothetical protein
MPKLSERGKHKAARSTRGRQVMAVAQSGGRQSRSVNGGVVYYIAAPDLGRVKIGRTKDLRKRLISLRGGSPADLEVLGTLAGGAAVEMYLYAIFADDRIHGEWFNLTPEIATCAATGELPDAVVGGIQLGALRADGPTFRRFARIEMAIAEGHDAPSMVAKIAGCTPDQLPDAILAMRGFGFLRGTYAPDGDITLLAA